MLASSAIVFWLLFAFTVNAQTATKTTLKLKATGDIFSASCLVNGLALDVLLDTGSADNSITREEAAYMLANGYLPYLDASIIDGSELNLKTVELGSIVLTDVHVRVSSTGNVPLRLGLSALKKLGKFELNYTDQTITLYPSKTDQEPSGRGKVLGRRAGDFPATYHVKQPVVVSYPSPVYTDQAREATAEGIVLLQCIVKRDGTAHGCRVLKGLGYGLDESAIHSVQEEWRFKPGTFDGHSVDFQAVIEVIFRLKNS